MKRVIVTARHAEGFGGGGGCFYVDVKASEMRKTIFSFLTLTNIGSFFFFKHQLRFLFTERTEHIDIS